MDKVLLGGIEPSVRVFDGFVNLIGGDLVNLFSSGLEKACSDNMAESPVSLTQVSGAVTTSVSWWSENEGEAESGPSTSKRQTGGKTSPHRGCGKSRGCH